MVRTASQNVMRRQVNCHGCRTTVDAASALEYSDEMMRMAGTQFEVWRENPNPLLAQRPNGEQLIAERTYRHYCGWTCVRIRQTRVFQMPGCRTCVEEGRDHLECCYLRCRECAMSITCLTTELCNASAREALHRAIERNEVIDLTIDEEEAIDENEVSDITATIVL
jgi:hypothetical protein